MVKSLESIQTINNNQLENYIPDKEQLRRVGSLLDIARQCEDIGIIVTVLGGYGLDGIYGKLTRSHDDIDMLVTDSQINGVKTVLEILGYQRDLNEVGKYVYKNVIMDPSFKVEFVGLSTLEKFTKKDMNYFIPSEANASLDGQPFRAMTLQGQKDIIEIQNIRAKQEKWNDYPIAKRQNQSSLISELERKNIV